MGPHTLRKTAFYFYIKPKSFEPRIHDDDTQQQQPPDFFENNHGTLAARARERKEHGAMPISFHHVDELPSPRPPNLMLIDRKSVSSL